MAAALQVLCTKWDDETYRSTGALQRSGPQDTHNLAFTESGGALEFVNWVVNLV